jgi:acyl-CoA reductase-like NAD-dependent aldehyde dehydrogenase
MRKTKLWISDQWIDASKEVTLKNPHNGEILAEVGYASPDQAKLAIDEAAKAYESFKEALIHERSSILRKAAQILQSHQEEAARIITGESAKPIKDAREEITRTIQTYQLSAEAAKNLHGEVIPMDAVPKGENHTAYVTRQSMGVITAITPFNFLFNLVAHKVGPAIAAGNTIVLKPAKKTPLSSLFLADLFQEAGLPAGVLNIIPGDGKELSEVLTTHDKVSFVTFTGSPKVGAIIRKQAGFRKVTLELGSNSPIMIDRGFSTSEME